MKKLLCGMLIAGMLLSLSILPHASAASYDDLCKLLAKSFAQNELVDLSAYRLNEDALDAVFVDVWYSGKLPWYAHSYQYSKNSDGVITSFAPIYYDTAEYDYARYEQAVAKLLDTAILEGMTQWEQALAVHDYLILNSQYDESLAQNTNYALLVNGTAVCSGYAMAYLDIMTRLGIACRFVESQAMAHAWNMVNIDGNWYHVDLTYDDPTPDSYGYVSHTHFLKTDAQMEEMGYHGWSGNITCTDETFSQPFWENCNSQIIFAEGQHYTRIKNEWDYTIRSSAAQDPLYTLVAQTLTLEKDPYHYETNGLSLWEGRLWFSGVDRVWSMALDGTDLKTEFWYDVDANAKFIYGSYVAEGTLYLTLSDAQYNLTSHTLSIADTPEHTHSFKSKTLESSCTQAGGVLKLCSCGICEAEEALPIAEHSYEAYITQQATCQQAGEKMYICAGCSHSYKDTYTDVYAHQYASVVTHEPTLFSKGTKSVTCRVCGYATLEAVPRLSWEEQLGLNPLGTIVITALMVSLPFLIVSSRKQKSEDEEL